MHTEMEAHTEQSFTMFWMMSDGRSGDAGIRLLGCFQVNEGGMIVYSTVSGVEVVLRS